MFTGDSLQNIIFHFKTRVIMYSIRSIDIFQFFRFSISPFEIVVFAFYSLAKITRYAKNEQNQTKVGLTVRCF